MVGIVWEELVFLRPKLANGEQRILNSDAKANSQATVVLV